MPHDTGSLTGLHDTPIFTQRWLPDGPPRAAVFVAHGLGEHSGRYAHVAARLVGRGFAVYTLDHRGHGQSGGPRAEIDRFDDFVDDLRRYFEQVRAAPPVFLYGHSMGSLIALRFAARYPGDLAGLITTGTALHHMGRQRALVSLGSAVARVAPGLRVVRINPAWVSRDPVVVQRYRDDALNYHRALSMRMAMAIQHAAVEALDLLPTLQMPYLALHGGDDPLCFASGVGEIRRRCDPQRTQTRVYAGLRHEIHNEPEQGEVIDDMIAWMEAVLSGDFPPSGK